MSFLRFPYGFASGRSATASTEDRVKQLIEQVVFTTPGERVNRPTFGSDLARLVFAPNGDAAVSVAQMAVQSALTQWLADLVLIQAIEVVNDEATMRVTVQYVIRETQQQRIVQVTSG